jgi:hypothetical protein
MYSSPVLLANNKTFVDMVPQYPRDMILKNYSRLQEKDSAALRAFVLAHFICRLPRSQYLLPGFPCSSTWQNYGQR